MFTRIAPAAALAIAMAPGLAFAQDADGAPSLSLGVSSLGPTIEGSFRFNDRFGARGLWAGYDIGRTESLDGADFDADISLGGVGLMLDYYPFERGLRLSGGYFMSNTEFSGTATSTAGDQVNVGGEIIDVGETLTATATFARTSAPMVTLGYDQDLGSNWTLTGEIGAIFSDGFEVTASSSDPDVDATEINTEINNLEDDLNDLDIYPYLSLKASFRF